MSRAVICDGCGMICTPDIAGEEVAMNAIWVQNPYMVSKDKLDDIAALHLCGECYSRFEEEYLSNLKECS